MDKQLQNEAKEIYEYISKRHKFINDVKCFTKSFIYFKECVEELDEEVYCAFNTLEIAEGKNESLIGNTLLVETSKHLHFCANNSSLFKKNFFYKTIDINEIESIEINERILDWNLSIKTQDKKLYSILSLTKEGAEEVMSVLKPFLLVISENQEKERIKQAEEKRKRQEKARETGYQAYYDSIAHSPLEVGEMFFDDFFTDTIYWGGNLLEKHPTAKENATKVILLRLGFDDLNPMLRILKTFVRNSKDGEAIYGSNFIDVYNSSIEYSKNLLGQPDSKKALLYMKRFAEKLENDYTILLLSEREFENYLVEFEEELPPNR